jgi:hypothetical protein
MATKRYPAERASTMMESELLTKGFEEQMTSTQEHLCMAQNVHFFATVDTNINKQHFSN